MTSPSSSSMPTGCDSSFRSKPGTRSTAWSGGLMAFSELGSRKALSPQFSTWLPSLTLKARSPTSKRRLTK